MSAAAETTIADYTPNVAIVTGASRGIGRAIALRLADDGFDVAVNDIPQQKEQLEEVVSLIQAKGKKALAVFGDVSVEADVERLVLETAKELGGVDVMVANAGITGGQALIDRKWHAHQLHSRPHSIIWQWTWNSLTRLSQLTSEAWPYVISTVPNKWLRRNAGEG